VDNLDLVAVFTTGLKQRLEIWRITMVKTLLITLLLITVSACADGGSGNGLNECGGVEDLNGYPGELCNQCGIWKCSGPEEVVCEDPGTNECNGCAVLEHPLDEWCGECRSYICDGGDNVICADTGPNECGGCSELPHPYGSFCGACGAYDCDGNNDLQCVEGQPNDCGGCFPLENPVGTSCGTCGAYICNSSDNEDTICNEMINSCGGCQVLENDVDDACGDCGLYECTTDINTTVCANPDFNVCGGCDTLPGGIGAGCACDEGTLSCDGENDMNCTVTGADDFANRTNLGNFEDGDDTIYSVDGTLDPDHDLEDWYQTFVDDTIWGDMDIRAWLDNIPAGHNYDLCVYYHPGEETEVDCILGSVSTLNGDLGCCSTLPGAAGENVELSVNALGTTNEDGFFYYRIYYVSGTGSCSQYNLTYAF
jgi:hypothetical protein